MTRALSTWPGCVAACRACKSKTKTYPETLADKMAWSARHLGPWRDRLAPARASLRTEAYRERILLHVESGEGGYRFGLFQDEAVLEIPDCPLHVPVYNEALERLRALLPRGLPLRFVFSNRALLTLVMKSPPFELDEQEWQAVREWWPSSPWQGLVIDFNPSCGRRVFSAKQRRLVWGTGESEFLWQGRSFTHGPVSFLQNDFSLYADALARVDEFLGREHALLDLYCGIGMSTSIFGVSRPILGIEVAGESLAHARTNARHARFLQGTVEDRLPQLREFCEEHGRSRAFVNPSRLGLGVPVIQGLASLAIERVAYLSCHPRSLAEDLQAFEKSGYAVESITPYDFFPRTGHIENLALLTRNTD